MVKVMWVLVLLGIMQTGYGQAAGPDSRYPVDTMRSRASAAGRFKINDLYMPAALLIAGVSVNGNGCESLKNEIVEERNEHCRNFRTHLDDYLQYSPIAIAYGLDAFGVKSRTDLRNRTVILLKSEAVLIATTHLIKSATHIQRPDHSDYASFPSGHTAQAFAAATFLSEEYGHQLKWMPYVSYSIAASVGALRMVNNKHFVSDVLAGAGIGILSVKLSYWTHRYKW